MREKTRLNEHMIMQVNIKKGWNGGEQLNHKAKYLSTYQCGISHMDAKWGFTPALGLVDSSWQYGNRKHVFALLSLDQPTSRAASCLGPTKGFLEMIG